jgi:hypothetical protein
MIFFYKPIRHPGTMDFVFSAENTQSINGMIKSDIKIIRRISGLTLKVSCYLVDGIYVGSCVNSDFCQVLKRRLNFSVENCPEYLFNNSIDCACPFNLPARLMDIKKAFDLPDFSTTPITWLGSGDFDLDVKLTQGTTSILCLSIKFSTKPK